MKNYLGTGEVIERLENAAAGKPHSQKLIAEGKRLSTAMTGLQNLIERRDPTETIEKHSIRVAKAAEQLEKLTTQVEKSIASLLSQGAASILNEMTQVAPLKENEYASEIRAVVRGMEMNDRTMLLVDAVKRGDAPVVAALTNAPSIITGLTPEFVGQMKEAYFEKNAPEQKAASKNLFETETTLHMIVRLAKEQAAKAVDPRYIADIQAAAAEAEKARAAFDGAVGA